MSVIADIFFVVVIDVDVVVVDQETLPLKFCQNRVSSSSDIVVFVLVVYVVAFVNSRNLGLVKIGSVID